MLAALGSPVASSRFSGTPHRHRAARLLHANEFFSIPVSVIRLRAQLPAPAPGQPGPAREEGQEFTERSTPQGFRAGAAGPTALVDQDTVAGVTRVIVKRPEPGAWTISLLPGSVRAASVQVAQVDPPLDDKTFAASIENIKPSALDAPNAPVHGTTISTLGVKPGALRPRAAARARAAQVPAIPDLRPPRTTRVLRDATIPAAQLTGMPIGDLRRLKFEAKLPAGTRVSFVETGPLTAQRLGTAITPDRGNLEGSMLFRPARTADARVAFDKWKGRHHIEAHVETAEGVPRGSVVIATLEPAGAPKPLEITDVDRVPGGLLVTFDRLPELAHGTDPLFNMTAAVKGGPRTAFGVSASELGIQSSRGARVRSAAAATAGGTRRLRRGRATLLLPGFTRRDEVTLQVVAVRPLGVGARSRRVTDTHVVRATPQLPRRLRDGGARHRQRGRGGARR